MSTPEKTNLIDKIIRFCLENKLFLALVSILFIGWGVLTAPFDWQSDILPRHPVPVDAIPDIGENQQIVFTEWPGRSPQDVEDQITYPLTVSLMGIPDVKTIRSYSFFGYSSIYIIFEEKADFYPSRSRILEKLNSLTPGTLPENVKPALGPDATALGQVFWYTLEGRDDEGNPVGGWDPQDLRSIQDWQVRYALQGASGISEVASIGGYVKEYQIDVDPDAMRAYGVTLENIFNAVKASNIDVGARTLEFNKVEYVIRGLGFIKHLSDIENTVIKVQENVPVTIRQIAKVSLGPAFRRGALDKGGAEAVGGVVVVRYGYNPLQAIKNVKEKIAEIAPGLPSKNLADGTISQVTIVPFYDRTGLIYETLGTLESALTEEILVTIIVVLVMVMHLRSSILISAMLPLSVLLCFVAMKLFKVDANIVALSGIAIAIGTIVDMGIIICENILKHLHASDGKERKLDIVYKASSEVGGAVLTAVTTTIVGFLPVFTMTGAEGKLFRPLAFTKTFALLASIVIALTVIPVAALILFEKGGKPNPGRLKRGGSFLLNIIVLILVAFVLAGHWMPLGPEKGLFFNTVFILVIIGSLLLFFYLFQKTYPFILAWCLNHKVFLLSVPVGLIAFGGWIWTSLGNEFMPPLDEGSFLYMPTTMPHASIGEALDVLQTQDLAFQSIPEIDSVVGKIGRADSPLDPAPVSMVETVINYKSEYLVNSDGKKLRFKYDRTKEQYLRDDQGKLIPDKHGRPYRQWREHIHSADDIWNEIVAAGQIPGTTSAPKLQPIAARLVMLQSGMRAPMGIKVKGPDLKTIEKVALELEAALKEVEGVEPSAVIADRVVGKPYLEIDIDREKIARYGLSIQKVQNTIEVAVGGKAVTMTVEGRERYPVRIRYMRELRDEIESLGRILVAAEDGSQIPLIQLADIRYIRGPQAIKSEDTFLLGYVLFDKKAGYAEVNVVDACKAYIKEKIDSGEITLPNGVSYVFAGSYENQLRAQRTLALVIPLALFIIFMILYFQFKSIPVSLLIFFQYSGCLVGWIYHDLGLVAALVSRFQSHGRIAKNYISDSSHQFKCGYLGWIPRAIWDRFRRWRGDVYLSGSDFSKEPADQQDRYTPFCVGGGPETGASLPDDHRNNHSGADSGLDFQGPWF